MCILWFQSRESQDDAVSAPLVSRTLPMETRTLPLENRTLPLETRTLPLDSRTLLGDRGASGGTPLGGAVVTSSSWAEDTESESWEATVPPVSTTANTTASCTDYH